MQNHYRLECCSENREWRSVAVEAAVVQEQLVVDPSRALRQHEQVMGQIGPATVASELDREERTGRLGPALADEQRVHCPQLSSDAGDMMP